MTLEQILKLILTTVGFLGLGGTTCATTGCASAEREAQIATFKEVTLFAKEMGIAGQAHLSIGGAPAFDLRTGDVLDTGVKGNITLQFNALADPRGAATTGVGAMVEVNEHPTE